MNKFLLAFAIVLFLVLPCFGADKNVTFGWQQELNSTFNFSWTAVEGFSKYRFVVHEDGTPTDPCSSLTFCADVVGLSQSVVLKPNTKYDFKVAVANSQPTRMFIGSYDSFAGGVSYYFDDVCANLTGTSVYPMAPVQ